MVKLRGLKKAVGDYQRANSYGYYSPWYGVLMLDRSTGELWTDEFYSLGHNEWKVYYDGDIIDPDIITLVSWGHTDVTMAYVKVLAIAEIAEYEKQKNKEKKAV